MYRKPIFGITLVIGILALGAYAFANGPGYGFGGHMMGYGNQGHMSGYGPGHMMGYGNNGAYNNEAARISNELYQKQVELDAVLSAPELDRDRAKSLNKEINELRDELADASRTTNEYGRGYGRGNGHGYGRGYHW